jgi:hypothetical protein
MTSGSWWPAAASIVRDVDGAATENLRRSGEEVGVARVKVTVDQEVLSFHLSCQALKLST